MSSKIVTPLVIETLKSASKALVKASKEDNLPKTHSQYLELFARHYGFEKFGAMASLPSLKPDQAVPSEVVPSDSTFVRYYLRFKEPMPSYSNAGVSTITE